mgnify:CR=1 FL=1
MKVIVITALIMGMANVYLAYALACTIKQTQKDIDNLKLDISELERKRRTKSTYSR